MALFSKDDGKTFKVIDDMNSQLIDAAKKKGYTQYQDMTNDGGQTVKTVRADLIKTAVDKGYDFAQVVADKKENLAKAPKQEMSMLDSLAAGYGQGFTMGYGDEAGAAIRAGLGQGNYEDLRDVNRAVNKEAEEANSWTYKAGELAGGVLGGIGLGKLAGLAAPGLSTLAAGTTAKTGQVLGSALGKAGGAVAGKTGTALGQYAGKLAGAAPVIAAGGAAGGALQSVGESEADTVEGLVDAGLSGAAWGAGGALAGAGLIAAPSAIKAGSGTIRSKLGKMFTSDAATEITDQISPAEAARLMEIRRLAADGDVAAKNYLTKLESEKGVETNLIAYGRDKNIYQTNDAVQKSKIESAARSADINAMEDTLQPELMLAGNRAGLEGSRQAINMAGDVQKSISAAQQSAANILNASPVDDVGDNMLKQMRKEIDALRSDELAQVSPSNERNILANKLEEYAAAIQAQLDDPNVAPQDLIRRVKELKQELRAGKLDKTAYGKQLPSNIEAGSYAGLPGGEEMVAANRAYREGQKEITALSQFAKSSEDLGLNKTYEDLDGIIRENKLTPSAGAFLKALNTPDQARVMFPGISDDHVLMLTNALRSMRLGNMKAFANITQDARFRSLPDEAKRLLDPKVVEDAIKLEDLIRQNEMSRIMRSRATAETQLKTNKSNEKIADLEIAPSLVNKMYSDRAGQFSANRLDDVTQNVKETINPNLQKFENKTGLTSADAELAGRASGVMDIAGYTRGNDKALIDAADQTTEIGKVAGNIGLGVGQGLKWLAPQTGLDILRAKAGLGEAVNEAGQFARNVTGDTKSNIVSRLGARIGTGMTTEDQQRVEYNWNRLPATAKADLRLLKLKPDSPAKDNLVQGLASRYNLDPSLILDLIKVAR